MAVQYNFCNRDFFIDHKFLVGLRFVEFPGQSNRFNFCFLENVFTFWWKTRCKMLLEFSSTIRKCLSHIWNDFSFNYVNVFE